MVRFGPVVIAAAMLVASPAAAQVIKLLYTLVIEKPAGCDLTLSAQSTPQPAMSVGQYVALTVGISTCGGQIVEIRHVITETKGTGIYLRRFDTILMVK